MMRFTDFARRIQLAGARSHLNLDICALAGAGAALVVLLLFYVILVAPEIGEVSNTAAMGNDNYLLTSATVLR